MVKKYRYRLTFPQKSHIKINKIGVEAMGGDIV